MTCPPQSLKCFSHLTQDAAYVFATRDVTRMVKVFHDAVEALWNLFILLQITASKLGVLFAKCQWLPGFERGLVVQTLRVTVPPPGLEEQQQQHMHEVVLHLALGDGMKDLQSHSVVMGFFFSLLLMQKTFQSEQFVGDALEICVGRKTTTLYALHFHQCWSSKLEGKFSPGLYQFAGPHLTVWSLRCQTALCAQVWMCVCIKHTDVASHLSVIGPQTNKALRTLPVKSTTHTHQSCRTIETPNLMNSPDHRSPRAQSRFWKVFRYSQNHFLEGKPSWWKSGHMFFLGRNPASFTHIRRKEKDAPLAVACVKFFPSGRQTSAYGFSLKWVFALDMCSLAAAAAYLSTATDRQDRERFFHSDTEPRCNLRLTPSLPPSLFPLLRLSLLSFSVSYKDTCIPSHSMWSILPWSCNSPTPCPPTGLPLHLQHSQTSFKSLPFPGWVSLPLHTLAHVCLCLCVRSHEPRRVLEEEANGFSRHHSQSYVKEKNQPKFNYIASTCTSLLSSSCTTHGKNQGVGC